MAPPWGVRGIPGVGCKVPTSNSSFRGASREPYTDISTALASGMDALVVLALSFAGNFAIEVIDQEPVLPDVKASLGPLRILTG